MRRLLSWLLVVVVSSLVSVVPGAAQGQDKKEKRPPAPEAWLEPFAVEMATQETYDDLRERLFTKADDKDVIRGLAWLVHARDPLVRQKAARALGNAYMLGDHLGDVFNEDLLAAVRALARDSDLTTRHRLLSEVLRHDSPIAREIALQYVRGEIALPTDGSGDGVLLRAQAFMGARVDPADPEALQAVIESDDPAIRARWAADAAEAPASPDSGRFVTLDVHRGVPREVELRPDGGNDASAFSFWVSFVGWEVVRAEPDSGRPTSIDSVTVSLGRGPSAAGSYSRGAALYAWGLSGLGGDYIHKIVRYVGDDTLRVWVRAQPEGARPSYYR